jgi:hypothetical protein
MIANRRTGMPCWLFALFFALSSGGLAATMTEIHTFPKKRSLLEVSPKPIFNMA